MKKVMIVEDEVYMAEFLAEIIEKSHLDVRLCGVYQNGRQALDAIPHEMPHVIVTDIKMPEMDGLEFIRETTRNHPIKFVIISGYDDFHKVKEAFKLGAGEYFLKSEFDPNEFISTIERLLNEKTDQDLLSNPNHLLLIKENILREHIWGRQRLVDNNMLRLGNRNMCIMVIKTSNYAEIESTEWDKNSELLKYAILNISKEILDDAGFGDVCIKNNNEVVFAFSSDDHNSALPLIRSISTKLADAFRRHLGFVLSIGLSSTTDQQTKLVEKYNEAVECADYAYYKGRGVLILYDQESQKTGDTIKIEPLYKEFVYYKDNLEFSKMHGFFQKIQASPVSINSYKKLLTLYTDCFGQLLDLAKRYGINLGKERFNKLLTVGTFCETNEYFQEIIETFESFASNKVDVVKSVKLYIDKNYSSDLKLRELARDFSIDYAYLSKQFTLKVGMNFSKYLTLVRMKNALQLMMTTTLKLNEIASWVGYNSYENFSREFRKKYGTWPKEYKKEQGNRAFDDTTE